MTELIRKYKGIFGIILLLSPILWIGASGIRQHLQAETEETYEELKVFSDVLDIIEKNYVDPVESKELIRGAIQGMISSIDPHSAYLLPEAYKELQIETKGEFSGLGIVITMHNHFVTVVSPIEGSPAYEAGVKAGDQVVKVNGENTKNMLLWEAVKKMRGKKGTSVVITVRRKGAPEPIDFTIVRDIIPLESVRSYVLKPGFGYVRITNFREDTAKDVEEALESLEAEETPVKGVILDLRDNPGGLLDQSIKVADIFLDEGEIVSIKGRIKSHSKVYNAHPDRNKHAYPIVLLINEGSASASEIVAGALQDHGRVLVLGKTSFGKGSVQTVEPLRDGSGLKLTIARYYTPNGNAIQAKGIVPDVIVEQRDLSEDEHAGRPHIKEKDLENHISAEPGEEMLDEMREQMLDRRGIKIPDEDGSDLDPVEMLLSRDYQVRRALDILRSWQVFSKMVNGGNTS
ncbi:MAG: S41 family peptidase [Deltaproteobacteria bacterium]|nr:S41 family peptidase [Deltaproteobacteria bacterium]